MKLRRLVRGDIHFQWKYGFYFIYFVLTVIYVFGITALPDNWKHNAAAIMIYSDLCNKINGSIFANNLITYFYRFHENLFHCLVAKVLIYQKIFR